MSDGGEWLEADGSGGYASGPVHGPRTRRYHALLLTAAPVGGRRHCLVNDIEAVVSTGAGTWFLTSQRYRGGRISWGEAPACEPGVVLESFVGEPWPRWQYRLGDGTLIEVEVLAEHRARRTVVAYHLRGAPSGQTHLRLRPFFSGRDHHALHHANPDFAFAARAAGDRQHFQPYPDVPGVVIATTGTYRDDPHWYRGFEYSEELARGFPGTEDLAAPGEFHFTLTTTSSASVVLAATESGLPQLPAGSVTARSWADQIISSERTRRAAFASPLHRAADAYFIHLSPPPAITVIAGYPWFSDWGRDTFIALRGLALATGRWDLAGDVLTRWSTVVSDGMLPNRFAEDESATPEYNSVDAALWFVVAVGAYLGDAGRVTVPRGPLVSAVKAIIDGHLQGTRHGIHVTQDGLLAAGVPGLQLTWMDAKVDEHVMTPRVGKPVEVEALWLNALAIAVTLCPEAASRYDDVLARGRTAFVERFWNPDRQCLYDVVDVDHQPGAVDHRLRPNQIFAVGGLPLSLLPADKARAVVDAIQAALLTPVGLRTLAPGDPGYVGRYAGDPLSRDGAYHQGTVWPWLLGPFVEAWVRVRGDSAEAHRQARAQFLTPLLAHVGVAGVGHVSEVCDGDAPHAPGGCPFQAWSLGELLRLEHVVLA